VKKIPEEQTGRREMRTAVWDQNWLQAERELTEISERDEAEAEAVVWRNTAVRRRRDVHRVTVRPERRPEHKKDAGIKSGARRTEERAIVSQPIQRFNVETAVQRMSVRSGDGPTPRAFPNLAPSEAIRLQKGLAALLGFFIFLNVLWMCHRPH
jgi:hypothetical protein